MIDDDQNAATANQISIIVSDDENAEHSKFKTPARPQYRRGLSLILPRKRQRVESDSSASGTEEQRRPNFVYGTLKCGCTVGLERF